MGLILNRTPSRGIVTNKKFLPGKYLTKKVIKDISNKLFVRQKSKNDFRKLLTENKQDDGVVKAEELKDDLNEMVRRGDILTTGKARKAAVELGLKGTANLRFKSRARYEQDQRAAEIKDAPKNNVEHPMNPADHKFQSAAHSQTPAPIQNKIAHNASSASTPKSSATSLPVNSSMHLSSASHIPEHKEDDDAGEPEHKEIKSIYNLIREKNRPEGQ